MQHSENESRARLKMCSWIKEDFLFFPDVFFLLRKQTYLEFEKKKKPTTDLALSGSIHA